MWWSRTLLVAALLGLGPVGCGFKPLYGRPDGQTASAQAQALASVRVLGIDDRNGQILRNELISRLNPAGEPASARFLLKVQMNSDEIGLAESKDGKTTVARISGVASYSLMDAANERQLTSGQATSTNSYRYSGPRYASVVSERDSTEQTVHELAESIRMQLAAWFDRNGAGPNGGSGRP